MFTSTTHVRPALLELDYDAIGDAVTLLDRTAMDDRDMDLCADMAVEIDRFDQAIETIRTYGLTVGLRAHLDTGNALSHLMPGVFPSAETWSYRTYGHTASSELSLIIGSMEDIRADALRKMGGTVGKAFERMAARATQELADHHRWLTKLGGISPQELKGIPAEVAAQVKLMPVAQVDQAILAIRHAQDLLAKRFTNIAAGGDDLVKWAADINASLVDIAKRCPWVSSVPQFSIGTDILVKGRMVQSSRAILDHARLDRVKAATAKVTAAPPPPPPPPLEVTVVPITRGAPAATGSIQAPAAEAVVGTQSGMAAPGVIQQEATKAAAVAKDATVGQTLISIWHKLRAIATLTRQGIWHVITRIGRILYWLVNVATFGGLSWIRNHLTAAAKAAGAKIDAAAKASAAAAT